MADGIPLPAASGTAFTDDCGASGHAQVIKLAVSADGAGTLIPADASGLTVKLSGGTIGSAAISGGTIGAAAVTGGTIGSLASISGGTIGSVRQAKSSTGSPTSVAASASDGTILASNTSRFGAAVSNDGTATLYLLVGAGVSSTSNYTLKLGQDDYYEVPANYTGIIKGIWSSATGNARVTEWT